MLSRSRHRQGAGTASLHTPRIPSAKVTYHRKFPFVVQRHSTQRTGINAGEARLTFFIINVYATGLFVPLECTIGTGFNALTSFTLTTNDDFLPVIAATEKDLDP